MIPDGKMTALKSPPQCDVRKGNRARETDSSRGGNARLMPLPHHSELARYWNDSRRFVAVAASIPTAMEPVYETPSNALARLGSMIMLSAALTLVAARLTGLPVPTPLPADSNAAAQSR
jgi:hypothetical protein